MEDSGSWMEGEGGVRTVENPKLTEETKTSGRGGPCPCSPALLRVGLRGFINNNKIAVGSQGPRCAIFGEKKREGSRRADVTSQEWQLPLAEQRPGLSFTSTPKMPL